MSTCSHGRDLSTQVCKYCSCPHGSRKENCASCSMAGIKTTPATNVTAPASTMCAHGVDHSMLCGQCMIAAGSGSATIDMFGTNAEERARHQKDMEYRARIADMEKVPGAMRMFRTWQLDSSDNLIAMVTSYKWRKGENIASSMAAGGHSGFFGFSSLAELQKQEKRWWALSQSGEAHIDSGSLLNNSFLDFRLPTKRWFVSGTFLAYGHMVIAEHGGRSQFAVPEYIIEPDGSDPDFGMRILGVAEKYGMEIVSVATARELKVGAVPWWRGKPNK